MSIETISSAALQLQTFAAAGGVEAEGRGVSVRNEAGEDSLDLEESGDDDGSLEIEGDTFEAASDIEEDELDSY